MENIDCKQTTSAAAQQTASQQDQRLLLIRSVRKHPTLYKNEFLRTPFLHRNEKQQIWDEIAQESGFEKTEYAKCKWRSLIQYLRQHLDNVAQKKVRRYIPNTENPDDKYIQLTDWTYYSELEFIVPYVKYSCKQDTSSGKNGMEMSPNEIDMLLEGIETEREETQKPETENLSGEEDPKDKVDKLIQLVSNDDLTADDEILKEYFENMLKTTLKLPRFHQNRIKEKLLDTVNECE